MKFGAPDVIHTDQGSNFNSELMNDICRIFMIEKTRTTPHHPQGNGQVGRFNRVIADTLSKYCAEKPQEWDVYLPYITFVYNTTAHRTIGATPYSMIFGREAQYPIDLFVPKPPGDPRQKLDEHAEELNERLYEIHREAQVTMGTEQRQRDYFNRKVHGEPFKEGTLFGCSNLTRRSPESFICLGTVLSRSLTERVRSRTRFVNEEIKKTGKKYILTA